MKKSYWLIAIYLFWCLIGSLWYLFSVKNLTTDPDQFDATAMLIGIVEVLLMMLIAFVIGFGIAWYMQQEAVEHARTQRWDVEQQLESREREMADNKRERSVALQKLLQAEATLNNLLAENEKRLQQHTDAAIESEKWQRQYQEEHTRNQQQEGQLASAKFRIRLLESEVDDKSKALAKLKEELRAAQAQPVTTHRDWSDHPFVRPVQTSEAEKDDLTQIKGIGPKFMQKLNSLDLFSFRQISELSGEEVERLAEVIEVFPDRIHRDNWIGQATKLYLKKTSNE